MNNLMVNRPTDMKLAENGNHSPTTATAVSPSLLDDPLPALTGEENDTSMLP